MTDALIESFYELSVYGMAQAEKEPLLNKALNQLNGHHKKKCHEYNNLLNAMHFSLINENYADQPFVTARLFKMLELKSIASNQVFKQLNSSGTSSQVVSKIYLDSLSAKIQSKVLSKILLELFDRKQLGRKRLPMLLIDSPNIIKNKMSFSARGAGIQGLSFLGSNHTYALNDDMTLNYEALDEFVERFHQEPVLIFGFTFIVWRYLIDALKKDNKHYHFEQSLLLHSGGWKKMQSMAVDNTLYKQNVKSVLGNVAVHNFYGMVEQTGTIYVECEQGYLHAPVFSDIIIRDPITLKEAEMGEEGFIQLLSILPESYPGHSLLTEDLGKIIGQDDCACGRKGRYFTVSGRLAQSENRGCSDTFE